MYIIYQQNVQREVTIFIFYQRAEVMSSQSAARKQLAKCHTQPVLSQLQATCDLFCKVMGWMQSRAKHIAHGLPALHR